MEAGFGAAFQKNKRHFWDARGDCGDISQFCPLAEQGITGTFLNEKDPSASIDRAGVRRLLKSRSQGKPVGQPDKHVTHL